MIVFILYSSAVWAQLSEGTYRDKQGHYILIGPKSTIEFCLYQESGFDPSIVLGKGIYKIRNKNIIVHTKSSYPMISPSNVSYISNSTTPGHFRFHISDSINNPLTSASITFHEKEKTIRGITVDSYGNASLNLEKMPIDSIIQVFQPGFQPLNIKLNSLNGGTFNIILHNGYIKYLDYSKIKLPFKLQGDTLYCHYFDDRTTFILVK